MNARITKLPGGVKITFDGRPRYLPDAVCPKCHRTCPAAEFLKTWRKNSDGATVCAFAETCLKCEPPPRRFPDLRGARFENGTRSGKVLGWRERDRAGLSPVVRPLRTLRVRMVNGVMRPQPKLNRTKGASMTRAHKGYIVVDERRTFRKADTQLFAERQHQRCAVCDEPFTAAEPPVGDHILPHAQGWTTHRSNGQALHARCNSLKGARSLAWARQRQRDDKAARESRLDFD